MNPDDLNGLRQKRTPSPGALGVSVPTEKAGGTIRSLFFSLFHLSSTTPSSVGVLPEKENEKEN